MRAALYARYSTDLQRPTSIEDQVRLARARADSANMEVVAVHSDEGVSGSVPIEQRPGGRALMADAAALRFDVLILEALDRFSRNLVDQERVVRRLEFDGIRIIGVVDGYDSAHEGREMMRAVRGSFNEQLLRDIAKKTHRGLRGQIARGYHAGGLSFGYRSVIAGLDAKGEPVGHRLEIEPAEADVVRWLFARYAEGLSCQRLVADLNGRHVPAPRGGTWAVSALYGSPNKGSGILNNKLYIGCYVWNRSKWTKDPLVSQILAERSRSDAPAAAGARKRLTELEKEIPHLVDAVAKAGWSQSLAARLQAAEGERARLRTLADRRTPRPGSIDALQRHYKELLMRLGAELRADVPRARAALQELLGGITLTEEVGRVYAELETRPERLLMAAGGEYLDLVAGIGFSFSYRRRIRIT